MEIRPLRDNEMGQARTLWETCFQDHPAFLDWYFRRRFQSRDGLGIFLDGRLLSMLHLSPRQVKIRKRFYPSAYLLALATAPAFRHLGLARTLLTYALRQLAARQIFFTFLLPFNIGFYTRLGWGDWADHRLYLFPAALPRQTDDSFPSSGPWRFSEAKPGPQLLAEIYRHYLASWDGGLVRNETDWTCLLLDHSLDGGKIWLGGPASPVESITVKNPVAYALVLPGSPGGRPLLREMAWMDPQIKEAFLRHLISCYANSSAAILPESGPLPAGTDPARENNPERQHPGTVGFPGRDRQTCHLTPYHLPGTQPVFLGRITSVRAALTALAYPPLTAAWSMAVADPLLPENNGIYHLKLTNGKMEVTKTAGEKPDLLCSVGALTALITGRESIPVLLERGDLTLLTEELFPLLNQLFPPANNFVNEYF
ncbi:MAG TPA: GNAT family N-acetyltransferase [Capillibacterium sp.]